MARLGNLSVEVKCPACGEPVTLVMTTESYKDDDGEFVVRLTADDDSTAAFYDHIESHGDMSSDVVEEIAVWDSTASGGAS